MTAPLLAVGAIAAQANAAPAQAQATSGHARPASAHAKATSGHAQPTSAYAKAKSGHHQAASAHTAQTDARTPQADAHTAQADARTPQADAHTAQADARTPQAEAHTALAGTAGPGSYQGPVFVSPGGSPAGSGQSCDTATFTSIQSAVNAAPSGGSVVVCAGSYHQQVVIAKPLTVMGQHATIDETGVTPSLQLNMPGVGVSQIYAAVVVLSSNVRLTGFTVQHAQGEGILAAGLGGDISKVTISRNAVVFNDLGNEDYFECASDCGEGVHLTGVANSTIERNTISGNSGGILLTDDTGPTCNNDVDNNVVSDNTAGSGITVPGHNPNALGSAGQRQPSVAGVYRNTITHNTVTGNGVDGDGAGILFAAETSGTASYDNMVQDNYIAGNGLSGVTMYAGPGQFEDLSGNQVSGNVIETNDINGDTSAEDPATTGVLVFSAGTPVTVKIGNNHIADNTIGIWLSQAVTANALNSNYFSNVTTPVSAGN
jgi:parallel beta-helix repeat protein